MAYPQGQNYSGSGLNPTTDNTSQAAQQLEQPNNSSLKHTQPSYTNSISSTPVNTSVNQTYTSFSAAPTVDTTPNVTAGVTFQPTGGGIKGYHLVSVRRQGQGPRSKTIPLDAGPFLGFTQR